jgi:large subunit ribosomal protein L13
MTTRFPSGKDLIRSWRLIDARGLTLGRLASNVAQILMGKDHPMYTPFLDLGDRVIIFNAAEIVVSGNKRRTKIYYHYTGYPGGLRSETLGDRLRSHPEEVLRDAVWGMLPKSKLGRRMRRKLRVFRNEVPPSFQEVNVRKGRDVTVRGEKISLAHYDAFRARIISDMGDWIDSLPPSRRSRSKLLYFGAEGVRPIELLRHLRNNTELGKRFIETMYKLENPDKATST